jgi:hypothetical protein
MSRFKGKPRGGLPGPLPAGEELLWQGAPEWRALARHAFGIKVIGVYFAVLLLWRVGAAIIAGHTLAATAITGLSSATLGAVSLGIFCLFAWLIARSTTYTITSQRVVITYGMALPKSVNLPFSKIDGADLRVHQDGAGDISLQLNAKARLSYLLLWPHVRSGKQGRAQPVLRCVADAQDAAQILIDALGETLATRPAVQAVPADVPMLRAQAA